MEIVFVTVMIPHSSPVQLYNRPQTHQVQIKWQSSVVVQSRIQEILLKASFGDFGLQTRVVVSSYPNNRVFSYPVCVPVLVRC